MKRPNKKQSITIAVVVLALGATVVGALQLRHGPSIYASAISSEIQQNANFTIYVPRSLPDGYTLSREKGVSFTGGMLFMQFVKDDQTVYVVQQKKPNPEPSISTLSGFKPLDGVAIGKAVIGEQEGSAAAIVIAKDTLVSIAGDGTVSTGDLGLIAKRLQPIE